MLTSLELDDDIVRRDSLHAIINALPDPNYATIRALILHLNRVAESRVTNMSATKLATIFGPILLRSTEFESGGHALLQIRAIDTIITYTLAIFDDD